MESLGQILQRQTQLTAEQLDRALRSQQTRRPRVSLGLLLVEQGLCSETEVCRALASQWNIPYVPTLAPERLRSEWIARIPLDYLKAQGMLPVADEQGRPQIALSDPLQVAGYDAIATILGQKCPRLLCPAGEIEKAISRCYYQGLDADGPVSADDVTAEALSEPADDAILPAARQEDLLNIANQAPIVKLVNTILFQAVSRRASDIHIEPYDDEVKIRYRIDGVLCDVPGPPKRQLAALISRLKIMSNLNIAERRLPQDGQCRVKIGPKEFDVRVSIIPTSGGERMVLRLLDRDGSIWTVDRLGFEPRVRRHFERTIRAPHGIFLLTGPTGSGKTTTLYCAINLLHNHERNILTVEDPIEYQLPGIGQTQVNPKIELTFANCLRHILRQDPDVIMIGEIRDRETAEIAVHASLTGHLVLSTLHTNDSASAITRLLDMHIEPYLISSSLLAVMAQRLVRVICPDCKTACRTEPPAGERDAFIDPFGATRPVYTGAGCERCLHTGYVGRTGIFELLPVDSAIQELIVQRAAAHAIKQQAVRGGMQLLRQDGLRQVAAGITTMEEVLRVTQDSTLDAQEASVHDDAE